MKRSLTLIIILALAASMIWMLGCSGDHHSTSGSHHDMAGSGHKASGSFPGIVSIYPSDGVSNISPSTAVSVKFSTPMNIESVMAGLHLVGGEEMQVWMDSMSHDSGMGGMMGMDMEAMMEWMDSICVPGEFHWNDMMDSCDFEPDSSMEHDCEYMILMHEGGMMGEDGEMMDTAGCGNGGYNLTHFTTGIPENVFRMNE